MERGEKKYKEKYKAILENFPSLFSQSFTMSWKMRSYILINMTPLCSWPSSTPECTGLFVSRGTAHGVCRSEPGSCSAVTWVQSSARSLRPSPRRPADRGDPRGQEPSGSGDLAASLSQDNGVERTCPPACFFPSFAPRILQVACEGVKHGSGKRVLSSQGNRIAGVKSTRRSIQRPQPASQTGSLR